MNCLIENKKNVLSGKKKKSHFIRNREDEKRKNSLEKARDLFS